MRIAESLTSLNALSPVDGRYGRATESLRPFLSEAGFMAHRVEVEVAWLIALSQAGLPELPRFSAQAEKFLHNLVGKFSEQDRSEERRVGKECRVRGGTEDEKRKELRRVEKVEMRLDDVGVR